METEEKLIPAMFYNLEKKILICMLSLCSLALYAAPLPNYKFKRLTTLNGLPSNDIQKIYQGRDGCIWMASRNGLYQYDGYTVKVFKSNLYQPGLLSSNNILCLGEDYKHRLWIGTHKGLNVLDKTTGEIEQITRKEFVNNTFSAVLITKSNRLLLGTDQGLYEYDYETDSCILYGRHNTHGTLPETPIKSIMQDSYGHIWIGTWDNGLYRHDEKNDIYYAYPKMNPRNSAHVIFEDSRKRIWVGTWQNGLQLLENAYDPEKVKWKTYLHKADDSTSILSDLIYSITEDANAQKIWVGTHAGISILTDEKKGIFKNYYPGSSEYTISDNEVNSLMRDSQGMIWAGLLRGGVNITSTRPPFFNSYTFDSVKFEMNSNSITSLFIDEDGTAWLSIGNSGIILYDLKTNKTRRVSEVPDFAPCHRFPTVRTIAKMSNGEMWFGTYNKGLYIYDKNGKENQKIKIYTPASVPWLPGYRIFSIYEDNDSNRWIGTNYGLAMVTPQFDYLRFDSLECPEGRLSSAVVVDICSGEEDEIWAASNNKGIYRISGKGEKLQNYSLSSYSVSNGRLNSSNVSCVFKDTKGRIWAGGNGGGLNLYDRQKNLFIPVHLKWKLPGDAVFNILEDSRGNLWLGTSSGLMKLDVEDNLENASYRLYTTYDGLLDNSFTSKGAFKTAGGQMFFGTHQGLNSFHPSQLLEDVSFQPPVVITDVKIHNRSWSELDAKEQHEISRLTPGYTPKIKLSHKNNNFTIEFAALGYEMPWQYTYAYRLEGFDEQWQYTNASRRFAYYNNLKSGTYLFKLKSTNVNGIWNDQTVEMQVVILPPPWETWWACLIYFFIAALIAAFIYRTMKNRLKLQNELQLREMEKEKAEELNHAKLQFFTNITHELLTPLTIISAAVDELHMQMPEHNSVYQVMKSNINRLIRLLQQILEFRKAETGNLKLKVSRGDLAAFITGSVESFQPLIKKKHINVSVICTPNPFPAWFDPDKLDKIIYNLLSNAAKYNKPGGSIRVELNEGKAPSYALITIADDGVGISKEAQKDLFKRFYEGDYRKFKTIGTGIGLSLAKDLVELHRGTIAVDSEEQKGTCFSIEIPIEQAAFNESEIEEEVPGYEDEIKPTEPLSDGGEDFQKQETCKNSILLIEDNDDLLNLMVKLLCTEYTVYTASNGKEGLELVAREDIDLVVSDIMMPVMDGTTFCKEIKSNFETSHIPVLLLTAKTGEADRVNAYESGADGYLNKPFNLTLLHARINNLLKARARMNRDFKKQLVFEVKELNYTTIDEEFLQKAIDCIHLHLDDPDYDQKQFVEDMGTTRSTLFRKMKSLTGLSYVSFIRNVRLKAACRIMEEKGQVRISELAYAVGFNDPRYFSTCFKKEFGMQPREYFERFVQNQKQNETADEMYYQTR